MTDGCRWRWTAKLKVTAPELQPQRCDSPFQLMNRVMKIIEGEPMGLPPTAIRSANLKLDHSFCYAVILMIFQSPLLPLVKFVILKILEF